MTYSTLTIQQLPNNHAFSALSHEWDALTQRSMTDTPFQTWAYQQAWWQHLGSGELILLAIRNEQQGKLVGIAPFFLKDGILAFNGSLEETDYLDLIAPANDAQAVWATIFTHLHQPDFPHWHTLDLCNVPALSPTRHILPPLAQQHQLQLTTHIQEVCPIIQLPTQFEDYLETLDKQQRHELRRKLRRAAGAEVSYKQVTVADNLHQEVEDFLLLLQKSTPQKQNWLNEGRRALFHQVAASALNAGSLQLIFLIIENYKAAALFNFSYKNRIWVYNSGLDPNNFAWLSAGVILTAHTIEQAILTHHTTFDFLRGSEDYKYRFGAKDSTIHRLTLTKLS